jgi:Flp pilus assembly pilin Flp
MSDLVQRASCRGAVVLGRLLARRDERGQAMTEYIVGFAAIVGLIAFSLTFRRAISSYLQPIYFIVSLPIP